MKKSLLILPIILICTSCSIYHKTNDQLLASPIHELETSTTNLTIESTITPEESVLPTTSTPSSKINDTTPSSIPSKTPDLPKLTTTPDETIIPSAAPLSSPIIEKTPEPEIGIEVGNKAPDFTAQTMDGKEIKLSDYLGKKVFLNFWATWCGPCTREMPSIQKIHENHPDIVILAVNCGEKTEDVKNFITKNNYTFNILTDENGQISYTYSSDYIPLTLIIDENGVITNRHVGSLTEAEMLKMLNKGE